MKDFLIAFAYPIKGLSFTWSHKSLLRLALVPILMNLGFFLLALFGFYLVFTGSVFPLIEFGEAWYYSILEYFLLFLAWLSLVLTAAITAFLITNILSALVFESLSKKTEALISGKETEEDVPFTLSSLIEPALAEVQRYGIYFFALILILPLNFLPVIGSVLYFACFAFISSFFFAYEFFDHTLSRRNMKFKEKKTFLLDNRGSSLGFGFGVFLLFLIPFAAIVIIPASVVGATLLICKRTNEGNQHSNKHV